jgi:phenylacetate-coenzyme A ligase PaaK-like adenylate-forming protein
MNEQVIEKLDIFDRAMSGALTQCCYHMMEVCDDMSESIDAMDKMVDLISEQQQKAIFALVSACLDMEKESGKAIVPHATLRKYVHITAETFSKDLLHNISRNLKLSGHPDILSPNQSLADEILEAINEA